MNNTINYIPNNNGFNLYLDEKIQKISNKNKLKKIIGNYSIGDLYIKAKLFEKCGQNHFNNFVDNFCDSDNLINILKNYKNYLQQIKEEESQNKKQICTCQNLCKRIFELMNPEQINNILNEIKEKFIENDDDNNYIIEQLKSLI